MLADDMGISQSPEEIEKKEKLKKEHYKFQAEIPKMIKFIERVHPTNTVQIEDMSDVIDDLQLYKMNSEPVDFSKFQVKFDTMGVDFYKDALKNHLKLKVDQLLALIDANHGDTSKLNEKIEPEVIELLSKASIKELSSVIKDKSIYFKKIVTKQKAT